MCSLFVLEKPFSENKMQLFSFKSNLVTKVPNYTIHRGRMTFKYLFISFLLMSINATLELQSSPLLSENSFGTPVSTDYYEGNMKENKRPRVREKHGGGGVERNRINVFTQKIPGKSTKKQRLKGKKKS